MVAITEICSIITISWLGKWGFRKVNNSSMASEAVISRLESKPSQAFGTVDEMLLGMLLSHICVLVFESQLCSWL